MSAGVNEERATPERGPGPAAPMRGPARFMSGMSTEKALDFKGSGRRLLGMLSPYRLLVILALALAVGSVTLSVLAPRLLGDAINLVFDGYESHHGVDFGHVGQIVVVVPFALVVVVQGWAVTGTALHVPVVLSYCEPCGHRAHLPVVPLNTYGAGHFGAGFPAALAFLLTIAPAVIPRAITAMKTTTEAVVLIGLLNVISIHLLEMARGLR